MSDKPLEPEKPADEPLVRPNPQDNPRNIVLNEIAKRAFEQHAEEAKESFPSMDDEGNITPAPAKAEPPADTPPVEEETPPAPAAEATPPVAAPAASPPAAPEAPDKIDPSGEYEVVVEGQKMKVKGSTLWDAGIRTFQKESAADFRLQVASKLLQEAEEKARASATPPGAEAQPHPEEPKRRSDADLSHDIQFGTPEQSAAAVAELRTRDTVSPEQIQRLTEQHARRAAQDEFQFQEAKRHVDSEFSDLMSNDYMRRLFFLEENRRRAPKERGGEGDRRPYKELYTAIGNDLRKSFNLPKPAAATPAGTPTPPGTAAARVERKRETPPVPRTAAARLSEAAAAEKARTPSEIIAAMAEARGQNRLTPARKGA